MAADASHRNGVALVIGVGQYPHPDITPLRFATHDAKAVADALADPDVCGFPAENVVLLTNEAAHRDAIIDRLSHWLPERGHGAEIVVIYFAGHGIVQKVGKREEGFLFPHDADPANAASRGVAMSDMARWVEGIEASAVVVCLDCCHAGKVLHRGPGTTQRRDIAIRPAILHELSGKGRFLLASCDEGQFSMELADLKHGLFTYHLLEGMCGAGDRDGDGRVGIAELFEYVSEAVARDAHKLGVEQKPWSASVGAGGVYLAIPRRRSGSASHLVSVERLARLEGTAEALREIERQLPGADEMHLCQLLGSLMRLADPAGVPTIFRFLNHVSESVRDAAKQALQTLGRDKALAAVREQVRRADEPTQHMLIDGLAFFEARDDLITLLDFLVDRLDGDAVVRAHQLLEKKRLSMGLEKTRELFTQNHSPYLLEKVLGQGLYTAAYLARHELAGVEVVVRVLRPEFVSQADIRKQFMELSRRSMRFVHHNLVLTRDVGAFPEQNVYFTVRDFVQGVTLQDVLHRGKRFEADQVVLILRQVVQALTPVHRDSGFHGGIKPSNIFLRGGDDVVILGDPSPPLQGIGESLKKRLAYDYRYAARELLLGGVLGPAVDFYALGCVAYELFCGQPPFVADHYNALLIQHVHEVVPPPSERNRSLSPRECAALLAFLEKDAARRVRSIAGATEALRVFDEPDRPDIGSQAGVPPPPKPPPPGQLIREQSLAKYRPWETVGSIDDGNPLATNYGVPAASPPPGTPSIPGYDILQELGRGGMGVVYKAHHVMLNRPVALKMMLAGAYAGAEQLTRFKIEALAVARLSHPNIVQIYDVGEYHGLPYLFLEYVEGESLAHRISGKPQPPREAAQILERLADAMDSAHQRGIIHRDLKPANVLLTAHGDPKITDFGLAKRLEDDLGQTQTGMVMGTPRYMAPEQARGDTRNVGPLSDVYALGAILYELLTGRPPFQAGASSELLFRIQSEEPVPPRRLQPNTPRDLETICLKCLQKEPSRRYSSAGDLAEDLRRFLNDSPLKARRESVLEHCFRLVRRRPAVAVLLMALVSCGLLVLALVFLLLSQ